MPAGGGQRPVPADAAGVAAAKHELRVRLRAARRASVGADSCSPDGEPLAAQVLGLPEVRGARTVAAYVSRGSEPSTADLLRHLSAGGVRVLLPVVQPDLDLDWALDDGTRRPGLIAGVLEPGGPRLGAGAVGAADVVVVPALAVDTRGRRLGQGGGSYDRALARARPGAVVVALLHAGELLGSVPVAGHDRPVDVAVTPERVVRFGGP